MRTFSIYKATDLTNDKIYIGKTSDFKRRKRDHENCYTNKDCLFHRAIKSHGKENFIWEIIDSADSLEEAYELEKKYIEKYNSYNPNGYNMTFGGAGGSMWNARPVVCLTLSGRFVKRYDSAGRAESEDGFNNVNVLLNCKGELRSCKGHMFMFEDEYIKHGAKKYEKPIPNGCRKIIQCNLSGDFIKEFPSVQEAARETGIKRTTISRVLTNTSKNAGEFIFVYKEDFPIKDISIYRRNKKGRKVAQLDPETNVVINVFERISEAGKALGVNYKTIHGVIDSPQRTAYGYKWISQ